MHENDAKLRGASRPDVGAGSLRANLVDIEDRATYAARITWAGGRITAIDQVADRDPALPVLVPGFVDAHVHIESSLLPPAEFARLAVRHGTVACVSDPHEIANVLGVQGVGWMLANAAGTPFRLLFGAPCCVPATSFETSGARLDTVEVEALLDTPGVGYLSEVMNFPGVLAGDPMLLAKISAARRRRLPVDGHAPGLTGDKVARYAAAGISTDHESVSLAEAEDKIRAGMRILIREGSAARNFETLHPLISRFPGQVMFCTDDCHPDDLAVGHIDRLVARAMAHGHDPYDVLTAASLVPQTHYGLNLGRLRLGDLFNAALLADLHDCQVLATWIDGFLAAEQGTSRLPRVACTSVNRFVAAPVEPEQLRLPAGSGRYRVIQAEDGQLFTAAREVALPARDGAITPSPAADALLLAVVNRYAPAPPALGLIGGFGLQRGALASSVAHDSHNIVAVGCNAESAAAAINAVIFHHGGLAVTDGAGNTEVLPLPVAGLMSLDDGDRVAARYAELSRFARERLGATLQAPFMTLSFMALLVIPALKLGDRGLFDATVFRFTELSCPA